ncbi:MAG: protein phosphatase 2C domain-containing protein [Erysipelotrichaceae bacterium]|nr:protein phosphatase 2C domain-containing protein [Erysipelotrichaceae bacterium]MDY4972772.1 protein phosphatase 2C domain-containing protein [Erysipelotrichaceae bacterium]MDY5998448.1 protein phosphatase 2C domain-containing protein [Erysipelotrichaceae bacterium]
MKCYGVTDKGLVRKQNQDSYIIATNEVNDCLALVCDGIGGANGGEIASKMAIDYFSMVFSEHKGFKDIDDAVSYLRYHIIKCNERIYKKATNELKYKGMGTTLSGILISSVGKVIINIGDSRVYGINENKEFLQLSEDHTLVNDMLKHHEITYEQALNHPKKNVLTNAMGVWNSVKIDLIPYPDVLNSILICSDGLHGYVAKEVIEEVMKTNTLTATLKMRKLLNLSLRVGGYDNITIILIELEKGDNR